jgi:hypothetical protein
MVTGVVTTALPAVVVKLRVWLPLGGGVTLAGPAGLADLVVTAQPPVLSATPVNRARTRTCRERSERRRPRATGSSRTAPNGKTAARTMETRVTLGVAGLLAARVVEAATEIVAVAFVAEPEMAAGVVTVQEM